MEMLIGGKKAAGSGRIEILNPATNEVIDTVPAATEAELDLALQSAAEGFSEWSSRTILERNRILYRYAALVEEHRKELQELLCRENGKNIKNTEMELDAVHALFTGYAEKAAHLYGETMPGGNQMTSDSKDLVFTRWEPLGVVVCLVPFNFPVDLYAEKAAPALAAGNAVIIKPPTDCPLTIIRLVELLHEAGVPPKAAQVVTGRGGLIGEKLVSDPRIAAVSLTGSNQVGVETYQRAAKNLTRVFLELGGNDAFIVNEDADLNLAVSEAVFGRMGNCGQTCCASKRFIVHHLVEQEFTRKLVEALKKVKIGDPTDPELDEGCMISRSAARQVEEQVAYTVGQGASCVLGGKVYDEVYFPPTVLTGVTREMDVARDLEIFGPVFPIIPFQTMDEAIAIANQSCYGLMGAVFSKDIKTAMSAAGRMQCGGVVINGAGDFRSSEMPFGGYKKSGIGREGIAGTLCEMMQEKSYVLKQVF